MVPIKTERLLIDEAIIQDAPFIYELLNSPTWIEFIGDRGITDIKNAERYIQESLIDNYKKNGYGLFKVVQNSTNIPIGLCGFLKRDYLDSIDIGYALLPEYEGKGYAYEAAKQLLAYAHTNLKDQKILAITSPQNKRSQRLLDKLGMFKKGLVSMGDVSKEVLLYST